MAPVNGHQGTAPGEEIGLIEVQLGKSATTATWGQSSFLTLLSQLDTQTLSEGCGGMTYYSEGEGQAESLHRPGRGITFTLRK